eukprot:scaffold1807_cov140-Cylindrotheca_fusiformis.AAC.25
MIQFIFALLFVVIAIHLEVASAFEVKPVDEGDFEVVPGTSMAVAHLGNSIQFYNDAPRLLQHMLKQHYSVVKSDSCFHGGANVTALYEEGNQMQEKFATPQAMLGNGSYDIGAPSVEALLQEQVWDFIVINDHSQAPAREENRTASIKTLQEYYVPLVGNATVIFLMTAAYKSPAKHSSDLGSFDHFTWLLEDGYQEYATLFPKSKIAQFGLAHLYIKDNYPLSEWEKLYAPDDFHPSPHGSYLQASMIYCTITGEYPPIYNQSWWSSARYLDPPMDFPSREEAEFLREIAGIMCGLRGGLRESHSKKVIIFLVCALMMAGFALCQFLKSETISVTTGDKRDESTCQNTTEEEGEFMTEIRLSDVM